MKNHCTLISRKIFLLAVVTFTINSASAQWATYGPISGGSTDQAFSLATDGNIIYNANSGMGVYISSDNGLTWVQSNTGLTSLNAVKILADGPRVFVATGGGLYVSTNNGASWTPSGNGMPANTMTSDVIRSGNDLYVSTWNDFNGIYKSSDNGANWIAVHTGLPSVPWCTAMTANSTNVFTTTSGNGSVFTTTDSGALWTFAGTGLPACYINSLATIGTNIFAATSSGGMYLSTNNGSGWSSINNGITTLSAAKTYSYYTNIFAGTNAGLFLSTDNGTNWDSLGLSTENILSVLVNDSFIFAGAIDGSVWREPRQGVISGIKESKALAPNSVLLYPNPAADYLNVYSSFASSVVIYNSLGERVYFLPDNSKNSLTSINTSTFVNGIYFIQLKSGNEFVQKRFLVQH